MAPDDCYYEISCGGAVTRLESREEALARARETRHGPLRVTVRRIKQQTSSIKTSKIIWDSNLDQEEWDEEPSHCLEAGPRGRLSGLAERL
jgi:hypothetical protein